MLRFVLIYGLYLFCAQVYVCGHEFSYSCRYIQMFTFLSHLWLVIITRLAFNEMQTFNDQNKNEVCVFLSKAKSGIWFRKFPTFISDINLRTIWCDMRQLFDTSTISPK